MNPVASFLTLPAPLVRGVAAVLALQGVIVAALTGAGVPARITELVVAAFSVAAAVLHAVAQPSPAPPAAS